MDINIDKSKRPTAQIGVRLLNREMAVRRISIIAKKWGMSSGWIENLALRVSVTFLLILSHVIRGHAEKVIYKFAELCVHFQFLHRRHVNPPKCPKKVILILVRSSSAICCLKSKISQALNLGITFNKCRFRVLLFFEFMPAFG